MTEPASPETGTFSLTNRGPADRVLARFGLASTVPPRLLVRAFVPALVIWLPLAAMAIAGRDGGVGIAIPFLHDLSTHIRFLVVVPLLILVEAGIGRRTGLVALQFVQAGLISATERRRFDALLRRAERAFESPLAETVIAILAASFVWLSIRRFTADGVQFWFEAQAAGGGERLTVAGWWYAAGSLLPPFLFLRWLWRYGVWCWLLQRISRFDLGLVATHADGAGGLAFVNLGHTAFAQLGFAASCIVAGAVGMRILYEGASLAGFKGMLALFIVFSVVAGLAPLTVFWRPLRIAKERGILDFGSFATRYVQDFQRRWVGQDAGESPLEAREDLGPLCDIGTSVERVFAMRLLPITLRSGLSFALASLAPMLPLLLTVMPLRDLLKLLMQAMI